MNDIVKHTGNQLANLDDYLDTMAKLEKIADMVANSETFKAPFVRNDKDGNPLPVNKFDIVANLLIGHDLGFTPAMSITLGNKLNPNSILAIQKGREMGLSPTSSMELIHVLEDKKTGTVRTYCGVHSVKQLLLKNGVIHEFIKPYAPVWNYVIVETGRPIPTSSVETEDGEIKHPFVVLPDNPTEELIKDCNAKNLTLLMRSFAYYESVVKFKRTLKSGETIERTYRYTSIDAQTNNYLPMQLADGTWTSGSYQWIKMPHRMFPKEVYINGARDIADDIIYGISLPHELGIEDKDDTTIDTVAVDVTTSEAKDSN